MVETVVERVEDNMGVGVVVEVIVEMTAVVVAKAHVACPVIKHRIVMTSKVLSTLVDAYRLQ